MTGLQLKLARVRRKLKQKEVAAETGIPQKRLSLIESDKTVIRSSEVLAIRRAVGLEQKN